MPPSTDRPDYLRDRFPLANTDSVYMDGTAMYNLVRYRKPGIIKSIQLAFEQAQSFRESVQEARAEAFDEGVSACSEYGPYVANPFRSLP